MSRNITGPVVFDVGSKLGPVLFTSMPILGFGAFVCVIGIACIFIRDALSALFSSFEGLDRYLEDNGSGLLIIFVMIPIVLAWIVVSLITRRWRVRFRKAKIFAVLLAGMATSITVASFAKGSHAWSQIVYHWSNPHRSANLAWNCPSEVHKVAPNTSGAYDVDTCKGYLASETIDQLCWQVYRTMQPIEGGECMWRRRRLTGVDWIVKGNPTKAYVDTSWRKPVFVPAPASPDEMRSILAKHGLTPL